MQQHNYVLNQLNKIILYKKESNKEKVSLQNVNIALKNKNHCSVNIISTFISEICLYNILNGIIKKLFSPQINKLVQTGPYKRFPQSKIQQKVFFLSTKGNDTNNIINKIH